MAATQTLSTLDQSSSLEPGNSPRRNPRQNAATGASAAGAFARAVNPHITKTGWSLHTTTPGLLVHAVRTYGWRFIPNQVMPPLLANAGIGAVLYTSYLQVLSALYEPVSQGIKRVYPPAPPSSTFAAGFIAGTIQSIVAAPLDALQVRLRANDLLEGPYKSMWQYGRHKLNQIGVRGIFAGWTLSFTRDALGYAVFFSFFEFIKSQAYYSFLTWYYGSRRAYYVDRSQHIQSSDRGVPLIRPHYALEPCFLMAAGVAASVAQQSIQHPLSAIQNLHVSRLEYLDHQASLHPSRREMLRLYYSAYQETYKRCKRKASRAGGWGRWLFRGFVKDAIRQVPSTSAGLVIFEVVGSLGLRTYPTLSIHSTNNVFPCPLELVSLTGACFVAHWEPWISLGQVYLHSSQWPPVNESSIVYCPACQST
ncbi:mitochondrial carrier [Aspergillus sclerotiicarbonarius CBS 121057]|uniref:Mitochondrial carrier n=1 Tax=Aspergillus sclerotiicarbonarius (strain CBS 121057 / IBT 28362) TaxID=1448318 RepID=A0A319E2N0_ASPSB|nr:mitochondrial carrier [Aspergillus sclerotiicarbonarius CBS 121057]